MQKTSLYESHLALGAKMISFGGWDMPRDYRGIASEVNACRTNAGLFDVSHMGEVRVSGVEALDFVQQITTNDAARLAPGKGQYSLLLNENGGVVDDVIVYCKAEHQYLIVVNAGCKVKDLEWILQMARSYDVEIADDSDTTALIAVQGPGARSNVQKHSPDALLLLKRFHFMTAFVGEVSCTVSRTGYTGEDGFEIFCPWDEAPKVWNLLIGSGVEPCGLAARDVLRIEAAYPLYGHELKETESPVGLGLGWAIKTSKLDFIGRHSIVTELQDGIRTELAGLTLVLPNAIPREGQRIYAESVDDPIGVVSSGTLSPTIGFGIALARIGTGFSDPGTHVEIDIRGRRAAAVVTKLPFYRGLDH